ncbi:MAG: Transcription factor spt8 [Geoglossum umbratile]|nr:MAG: Transcription factor spt8 [Geoglossum umbratile]
MPSFGSIGADYDERDGAVSPTGSSDQDETMEDVEDADGDVDVDGEADADADAEAENDEDNDDNDDNDDEDQDQDETQDQFSDSPSQSQPQSRIPSRTATSAHSPLPHGGSASSMGSATVNGAHHLGPTSHPNPTLTLTSPSPQQRSATPTSSLPFRPSIRPEALTAPVYDIVPTIAAPHSTSINTVTATLDLRWVFTGGSDGYIRKFNWVDTANAKVMLTVAQRHPFVDSVTKAGVLLSYWENEEPQSLYFSSPRIRSQYLLTDIQTEGKTSGLQQPYDALTLSPVYSLAVHSQALWLLSGLESGGINLQSVRHDEGKRIHCLRKHTSAVSVLTLAYDEQSFLSGSWDKTVLDWDLNTGQVKRNFEGSGGQISSVEIRPLSSLPVPQESGDIVTTNGTLASNNTDKPLANGIITNGVNGAGDPTMKLEDDAEDAPGSPINSLFEDGSLFGDDDGGPTAPSGGVFDEDDEFSRAIANGIQQSGDVADGDADINMTDISHNPMPSTENETTSSSINRSKASSQPNGTDSASLATLTNGLPHSEETRSHLATHDAQSSTQSNDPTAMSNSTFLAASIDGTLRVWDRRQPNPVARILPHHVPPWCMNACWSPDGNYIYAGRRNGTVEEFSLHKGLKAPERTFKFPEGSGKVSAVRAMPNGRHLICASFDILRLYDLKEQQTKHSTVPFLIVPGHRSGLVSQLYIDPSCRYLISTSGNRGWEGIPTEVLLGYEINVPQQA